MRFVVLPVCTWLYVGVWTSEGMNAPGCLAGTHNRQKTGADDGVRVQAASQRVWCALFVIVVMERRQIASAGRWVVDGMDLLA